MGSMPTVKAPQAMDFRGMNMGGLGRSTGMSMGNTFGGTWTGWGGGSGGGGLGGRSPMSYTGTPDGYPQFQSPLDTSGNLKDQYQMKFQGVGDHTVDTRGLEAIREMGLGAGLTESGKLAQKRLGLLTDQQIAGANQQGLANVSSGMASLGAYGASGGARERMTNQANRQSMNAAQQIRGQSALQDLGIHQASQDQRMAALQGLPQAELAYTGFNRDTAAQNANIMNQQNMYNTNNALSGLQAKNQYGMNRYGTQMQALGAEQTANAMAKQGGGGLFSGLFGGK